MRNIQNIVQYCQYRNRERQRETERQINIANARTERQRILLIQEQRETARDREILSMQEQKVRHRDREILLMQKQRERQREKFSTLNDMIQGNRTTNNTEKTEEHQSSILFIQNKAREKEKERKRQRGRDGSSQRKMELHFK
ncbi:Hypothetical predicted protein [Pelobates cultripes]|uniref:Uncharacterized protein n=1 Tax=Pelobates cultripes TaxID=61616 RepID=A0AAD1WSD8_PELCU|nr:Hypothetical predicted protein [Pelobates cultripes]